MHLMGPERATDSAGSCTSGTQVTFVAGLATGADVASITLVDAQPQTLAATDPSNGATGSLNLTVAPAALDSFTLAPSDASPVAGSPITVSLTALDQYQNVDTNYTGSQCMPLAENPMHLMGPDRGIQDPVLARREAPKSPSRPESPPAEPPRASLCTIPRPSTSWRPTSRASHFGSTTIDVTPGTLHSFAVIPDSTTETAGKPFNVRLTALDQYQNVDTNFTGAQCVTFSGPDNAPNGAKPQYPAPGGACATGSSAVTFVSGFVDGPNILSVTLFDAETADLTATLTTGTQTGSVEITVNPSPTIAGIGITGITQNTTPLLSCTGGVGSITCSSTGESASSGNVLTASIQLEDQYGNATVNATASPL